MPVVGVNRDALFRALGREYSEHRGASPCASGAHAAISACPPSSPPSAAPRRPHAAEEEFEELCFEYGIELDDVVRHRCRRRCPPAACPRLPLMLLAQLGVASTFATFYGLQTSEKEMLRKELANANADVSGASEEVRPPCSAAAAAGCCLAARLYPVLMLQKACAGSTRPAVLLPVAAAQLFCCRPAAGVLPCCGPRIVPARQLCCRTDTRAMTCCS